MSTPSAFTDSKQEYVETKVLATVELISGIARVPNSDSLWFIQIQGWKVIVNLQATYGDAANANPTSIIGTKLVYVQIDSIIPTYFSECEFWKYLHPTYMGYKVKTAKLRGSYSQGLTFHLDVLRGQFPAVDWENIPVGTNVTNILGITKYYASNDPEGPMYVPDASGGRFGRPASLMEFPAFLLKTDQPRLQANMDLAVRLKLRSIAITIKYDGTSVQFYRKTDSDGTVRYGCCSRNNEIDLELNKPENERDPINNQFRGMLFKYDIFAKLATLGRDVSLQTEVYGVGINGNRHKLKTVELVVFDIFDITNRTFLLHSDVVQITNQLGLPMARTVLEGVQSLGVEIDPWLELANTQTYQGGHPAEGIVVRTCRDTGEYISFKVISQKYLEKYE